MSNKYFDKYAQITTKDNKKYRIVKRRLYIANGKNYYGKKYIIIPETEGYKDMHLVNEIYSFDDNVLRILSDTYHSPKTLNTIEHSNDNSEDKPITVITDFDSNETEILSVTDIKKFESDKMIFDDKKYTLKKDEMKPKFNILRHIK